MTLDDLLETFRNHPTTREGVKAVVEALRDEMCGAQSDDERSPITLDTEQLWQEFQEILASDGVEATTEDCSVVQYTGGMNDLSVSPVKAAGGPARKDGPGGVEQAVPAVTPAAAPDVCVWTQHHRTESGVRWKTSCGTLQLRHGQICVNCDRPISFKEAAR